MARRQPPVTDETLRPERLSNLASDARYHEIWVSQQTPHSPETQSDKLRGTLELLVLRTLEPRATVLQTMALPSLVEKSFAAERY